jgi:hypothetical protein
MAGMNSQIHLILETKLKETLEKEALDNGISLSELCREKLRTNPQLNKIEFILEKIEKKLK